MAKIGCLKPFRGTFNSTFQNTVLEDGEIAFDTTFGRIFMGDGTRTISKLVPAVLGLRTLDLAGKNIDTIPQDFLSDYIIAGSRWGGGDETTGTVPTGYRPNDIRFLTYIRSYGAANGVMRIHVDFGATSKIYERIHWWNNTFSGWVEVSNNSNWNVLVSQIGGGVEHDLPSSWKEMRCIAYISASGGDVAVSTSIINGHYSKHNTNMGGTALTDFYGTNFMISNGKIQLVTVNRNGTDITSTSYADILYR